MMKMEVFKNKNGIVPSHSAIKSNFNIEFVEVDFFVVEENSKSKESSASWQFSQWFLKLYNLSYLYIKKSRN